MYIESASPRTKSTNTHSHTSNQYNNSKPISSQSNKKEQLELLMFYQTESSDLFPCPTQFPEFFKQNLTNPRRIITSPLPSPHANIQIFYYQLLLLGFQLKDPDGSRGRIANKFKNIVLSTDFEILFTRDSQEYREIFNNDQFKWLLNQFFNLLQTASQSVETIINRLPIIDTVMIHVIRSFLFYLGINQEFELEIPTETVFVKLAEYLGLRLTQYPFEQGVCWKFQDSDMFCFDQGNQHLYLAYVPIQTNQSKSRQQSFNNSIVYEESEKKQDTNRQVQKSVALDDYNILVSSSHRPIIHRQELDMSQSFARMDNPKPQSVQPMQSIQSANHLSEPQANRFNISNSNQSLNLGSQTFLHIINNFDNCQLTEYAVAQASSSNAVIRNVQYDSQNAVGYEPTNDTTIKFQPNSGLLFSFSRLPEQQDIVIQRSIPASQYNLHLSHLSNSQMNSPIFPGQTINYSSVASYSNRQQSSSRGNFMKNKNINSSNNSNKKNTSVQFQQYRPAVGYQKERKRVKTISEYKDKSISDYYNDFTSSFMLNTISQPYRNKIKNLKMRVKGHGRY